MNRFLDEWFDLKPSWAISRPHYEPKSRKSRCSRWENGSAGLRPGLTTSRKVESPDAQGASY